MKNNLIALAILAVIGVGAALFFGASTDAVSSTATTTAEFSVDRLSCGSCVETIRAAVSQIDGVASVQTDVGLGKSVVVYDPSRTDTAAIAKTISDSGYPAQLFARQNEQGEMVTDVDTELYIARIGERLIARAEYNALVEEQLAQGSSSGKVLPVDYMARFAWLSILQRELLLIAAGEAGVSVANAEVDAYMKDNDLPATERESARTDLLLERFFAQQNLDIQNNPAEVSNLLRSLQQRTSVQIFDKSIQQSVYGNRRQGGGCGSGGGCC